MSTPGVISRERRIFHRALIDSGVLSMNGEVASNADSSQSTSKLIARHIALPLGVPQGPKLSGQRAGNLFEEAVTSFVHQAFPSLASIRPGSWSIEQVGGRRSEYQIAQYEPYRHLGYLTTAIEGDRTLSTVLGNSYEISPDLLVVRSPEPDDVINQDEIVVDGDSATRSIIREFNQSSPIVHAVVSCKWTLRSDRAQNARSEALNIIRNRKGRTPHIAVVTAEPTPSRLASLALGTGNIDMVYHFALPELIEAVTATNNDEAVEMLQILVEGQRLRDISDLPLDLAV